MKRQSLVGTLVVGMLTILSGCLGSGLQIGPGEETRTLTGTLGAAVAALEASDGGSEEGETSDLDDLEEFPEGDCAADTVVATDSSGESVTTSVEEDCSFSIDLEIGRSYVVGFSLEGEFLAVLIFDTGVGFASENITIGDGAGPINLGQVTITGNTAVAASNPTEQMDFDEDGLSDFEDDDCDGDGVRNEEEPDCDLDGTADDFDEDNASCEEEDAEEEDTDLELAWVLEVKPRNDPHPELGDDRVDLDREIKARIACLVDPDSVNEETFRIEHDFEPLVCEYEVEDQRNNRHSRITCDPEEGMHPDSLHTAVIEGVQCLDGRTVETAAWSWLTEREDHDRGHYEDELDEIIELLEDMADEDEEDEDDEGDEDEDD